MIISSRVTSLHLNVTRHFIKKKKKSHPCHLIFMSMGPGTKARSPGSGSRSVPQQEGPASGLPRSRLPGTSDGASDEASRPPCCHLEPGWVWACSPQLQPGADTDLGPLPPDGGPWGALVVQRVVSGWEAGVLEEHLPAQTRPLQG